MSATSRINRTSTGPAARLLPAADFRRPTRLGPPARLVPPARPLPTARLMLAACLLLALAPGCSLLGPIAYYFRPPQIQKAAHPLPRNARLAVLFDAASPQYEAPVFEQALFTKLQEYFRRYESDAELIPLAEVLALRRAHSDDFPTWSVQRVGRELNADYVLWLRIEELSARESAGHPLLTPRVVLYSKLIAVAHPPADARVWPDAEEGERIECTRQAAEYTSPQAADLELAKLGKDTAWFVMMPFFDVDLEQPRPVER